MPSVDLPTSLEDDDLFTPEAGDWAERKYGLIAYYAEMFATSMKDKWASRVYIDLFAGAGRARVKGSSRIVNTSTLLALKVRDHFDRYVFCDIDPECIDALRKRVRAFHADRDVRYLVGDANNLVDDVLRELPSHQPGAGVLSFCFLDPRNLGDLVFSTVERLSTILVDFFVLIPSYMDAHRNERVYAAPGSDTVARFLGNSDWRRIWLEAHGEFRNFIVDQFGQSMKRLGFLYDGPGDEVPIYEPRKNVKLYHLNFYSRHEVGMKLWREARRWSDPQLGLFG